MVKADTQRAYDILNEFLVSTKRRRTPERYAVLEAICNMDNRFTIDHLDEVLTEKKFKVSRATLYNCVNLFLKLGFIVKVHLQDGTTYYNTSTMQGAILQICRKCGRITEQSYPQLTEMIEELKFKRFHRDNYNLYIYGVCGACHARRLSPGKRKSAKKQDDNNL